MQNNQPEGLKPGIYFNLSIEQYHRDPAISKSGMMDLVKSDLDYWVYSSMNPDWVAPKKKTTSLKFGTLVDMLLFEKQFFNKNYRVTGEGGYGNDNRIAVSSTEYNKARAAINELWSVEYSKNILRAGYSQISIFWRDKETGLMLKTRPDFTKTYVIAEYKTTESISDGSISNSITDYGYGLQALMEKTGVIKAKIALLNNDKDFLVVGGTEKQLEWLKYFCNEVKTEVRFIFQRSSFPYPFKIKHLTESVENIALKLMRGCLTRLEYCFNTYGTSKWPAAHNYSEEIDIWDMPFKFNKMAEDITNLNLRQK